MNTTDAYYITTEPNETNGYETKEKNADVQRKSKSHARYSTECRPRSIVLPEHTDASRKKLVNHLRNNVIGANMTCEGPYGKQSMVYCDYTASGKSVHFIENYIRRYVQPYYGNTHTTTSAASRQMTFLRDEARDIIKHCVNASEEDVVIYAGSGTTGAIHKLLGVLELKTNQSKAKSTVVCIGPYEHHSNILPWKEVGAKILRIQESKEGGIDIQDLESKLAKKSNGLKIVSCCAASNVTGIVTDVDAVAEAAHKHGAFVVFDYATAAPYLDINMNPSSLTYKDAVVCSPHKFVGGPGTSGLLIAKKHLFSNTIPDTMGGGTVLYVTRDTYAYLKDIEAREEGGTPAIIDSIRCGMVFQLKQAIGPKFIETLEDNLTKKAFKAWKENEHLIILGSHSAHRLPIFSFLIKHESGKYVHHNFVATILNDVFGIQARGGCACAGPYAADLLGLDERLAQNLTKMLEDGDNGSNLHTTKPVTHLEILKPGFCRLNFPYFMDVKTVDFVIEAVSLVAKFGWKLLPQYTFDIETGVWTHRSVMSQSENVPYSLHDITYKTGTFSLPKSIYGQLKTSKLQPKVVLKKALALFQSMPEIVYEPEDLCDNVEDCLPTELKHLVWFMQPREAVIRMSSVGKFFDVKKSTLFKPRRMTTVRSKSFFRSKSTDSTVG